MTFDCVISVSIFGQYDGLRITVTTTTTTTTMVKYLEDNSNNNNEDDDDGTIQKLFSISGSILFNEKIWGGTTSVNTTNERNMNMNIFRH
jgi:hypothetical protein